MLIYTFLKTLIANILYLLAAAGLVGKNAWSVICRSLEQLKMETFSEHIKHFSVSSIHKFITYINWLIYEHYAILWSYEYIIMHH